MGSYGKLAPTKTKNEVKDEIADDSQDESSISAKSSTIGAGSHHSSASSSTHSNLAPAPATVLNTAYEIVPRSQLSERFVLSRWSALILERLRHQKLTLLCRPHSHRHNSMQYMGGIALDPRYQLPMASDVHHLEYIRKRRQNEILRLETRKLKIKDSITLSLSRTYKEPEHALLKHEIQHLLDSFLDLICPPTEVDDYD